MQSVTVIKRILFVSSVLSLGSSLYRFSKKRDASAVLGVAIGALSVTRAVVELKTPDARQEPGA